MKRRIAALILVLTLLTPAALADIDLSGMTLAELIELRRQVNLAIMQTDEWQEVEVPAGVYEIGVDIPAGKWTISAVPGGFSLVKTTDGLNELGSDYGGDYSYIESENIFAHDCSVYRPGRPESVTWALQEGSYFIATKAVIFTPYAARDLGFK